MTNYHTLAKQLGTLITDQASFPHECECTFGKGTLVCVDFQNVGAEMFACMQTSDMFRWANEQIWNHPLRTSFFLEQPLNLTLMSIAASPPKLLNEHALPFVKHVLDNIEVTRIPIVACGILPAMVSTFAEAEEWPAYNDVFKTFASVLECREMMLDDDLFFQLAKHIPDDVVVQIAYEFVHTYHAMPVYRAMLRSFERYYVEVQESKWVRCNDLCHDLLDVLLSMERWRTLLEEDILMLASRPNVICMECVGYVYFRLIMSEFAGVLLMHLHTTSKLSLFFRQTFEFREHDDSWRCIWKRLCVIWPSEVEKRLNCQVERMASSSTLCCPITLEEYKIPAFAQDGHTYEMDAILTHFATKGLTSPMTKMKLRAILSENFVVKNK